MEIDRNVADYMQQRNLISLNTARLIAAQLLLVAVFFCAYLFLQNTAHFNVSLHNMRIIVKGTVVIISLAIALCAVLVARRAGRLYKVYPDDIALRQSRNVVDEAYRIAKDALTFKMLLSGVLFTAGIFASLMAGSIIGNNESGIYVSKALFFAVLAISILLFWPSCDRMNVYKLMLGEKHAIAMEGSLNGASNGTLNGASNSTLNKMSALGGMLEFCRILAGILTPLTTAVYIFWRYFGDNRSIAWIVFPAAFIILGAAATLYGAAIDKASKIDKH